MKILLNATFHFDVCDFQNEDIEFYSCPCHGKNIDNCRCYACDDKG